MTMTARERAAALFIGSDGQMVVGQVLRQLRLEGYDDIRQRDLIDWRKLDQWDDEIRANRAIKAATEGAMELNRAISFTAPDAENEQPARLPTADQAFGRCLGVVDLFGAKIQESLPHIQIKSVAQVVALANAMAIVGETAIELGKYVSSAREAGAKLIGGTDEDGNPIAGEMIGPAVRHGNVIEAIEAFKRNG